MRPAPASCGSKGAGLVSNEGDVTAASWSGAGALGVLDIQRLLYGYKVLCPTGPAQKLWVGRTRMVTMAKRVVKMVMTTATCVH